MPKLISPIDEEITIDYVNGFLRALSVGCHGTNYVPFYGATAFVNSGKGIYENFRTHLETSPSLKNPTQAYIEITNFINLEEGEWLPRLSKILREWIDKKSNYNSDFKELYKDDLLEQLGLLIGRNYESFYAKVDHKLFADDCEILCFESNFGSFYLHFSHSD